MDRFEVEVLNWDKYQGEAKRYKSTTWFAFQNTVYLNVLWDRLSDAEYRVFTFLLMHVSQKAHKTGRMVISITVLSRLCGKPESVIRGTLEKLSSVDISVIRLNEHSPGIHSESPVQSQLPHCETAVLPNKTEQNITPPTPYGANGADTEILVGEPLQLRPSSKRGPNGLEEILNSEREARKNPPSREFVKSCVSLISGRPGGGGVIPLTNA